MQFHDFCFLIYIVFVFSDIRYSLITRHCHCWGKWPLLENPNLKPCDILRPDKNYRHFQTLFYHRSFLPSDKTSFHFIHNGPIDKKSMARVMAWGCHARQPKCLFLHKLIGVWRYGRRFEFENTCCSLSSQAFRVELLPDEWHRTPVMIGQHWFR